MDTERARQVLAAADLPKPYTIRLLRKGVFSFREVILRVDPQCSRTFIDLFLSDARRTQRSRLLLPSRTVRMEFLGTSHILFLPPEGGTSLVASHLVTLPQLQRAAIRFHDLIGIMQTMRPQLPILMSPPPPTHRKPRIVLRA